MDQILSKFELVILELVLWVEIFLGNISNEINNRFPEIFPSRNFWKFFKNLYEISKNSLSPLKIDIEILNS